MKESLIPKDRYFVAGKKIYKETEAKSKKKFGKNSQAYKTTMNGIDSNNGAGSQFFFNNEKNLYLPKNQKVISLEDIERIYYHHHSNEFFDHLFYTDAPEIILRTETPTHYKNKEILEDLVKQVKAEKYEFSSENPLRISRLELVKDDNSKNKYGLLLKITKDTKIINDKRFASSNNKIQLGNQTKILYTKEDGLSGICWGGKDHLASMGGDISDSGDNGRVVVKEINNKFYKP